MFDIWRRCWNMDLSVRVREISSRFPRINAIAHYGINTIRGVSQFLKQIFIRFGSFVWRERIFLILIIILCSVNSFAFLMSSDGCVNASTRNYLIFSYVNLDSYHQCRNDEVQRLVYQNEIVTALRIEEIQERHAAEMEEIRLEFAGEAFLISVQAFAESGNPERVTRIEDILSRGAEEFSAPLHSQPDQISPAIPENR